MADDKEFLGFDDILPYLASTYRRGVLVPFIGSGMCLSKDPPACTNWRDFVTRLASRAGVTVPQHVLDPKAQVETATLYRLADRAVHGLSGLTAEQRADAYRYGLSTHPVGKCPITDQMHAFTRCHWPLVLTTNYDDLYPASRRKRIKAQCRERSLRSEQTEKIVNSNTPKILGRSAKDCQEVLRSLDVQSHPLLWALQGFLGGQARAPGKLVPESHRRQELAAQVVAGHQQYQHAINAQPYFRRAFAEVFQRRSLMFLGSGILEDYLLNLFGEIIHHYGPGPHPHFALFHRDDAEKLDTRFLQTRIGIVPVYYEDYKLLPRLLDRLADAVDGPEPHGSVSLPVAWMPDELGFALSTGGGSPSATARRVRLRYSALPWPVTSDECVVISVGREPSTNKAFAGSMARSVLGEHAYAWAACDPKPSLVYRNEKSPSAYAIAARSKHGRGPEVDARDLGVIDEAVCTTLSEISKDSHIRTVHLGAVASGSRTIWHPVHPFVQTLVGLRRFFGEHPNTSIQTVELHIVDPSVWVSVAAGKVPVGDILSSAMMKILVEIRVPDGAPEIFAVSVRGPTTVGDLKRHCELEAGLWEPEILPRPDNIYTTGRENDDDLLVSPSSSVVFSPRR